MNTCSVAAGPAAAWACSSVNTCARNSYPVELEPEPVKEREKGYVDLLVDASLLLVSNDFPPEVQRHGARMLQHLLKFRREELSSFDCSSLIHQDDTDSTNMSNKFDDIIHPRMRCNNGAVPCHQVKGCLLLAEYNILCEAFDVVTSCLRSEQYKGVLHYLLKPLNKIWVQSEWRSTFLHSAFGLTCLFSDHFLEMVYKVVKFCENDLRQSTLESIEMQFCDLHSLLRLMLPFLLQLLQCIHSLWRGQISGSLPDQLESAKSKMSDEDVQQNKTRKLLEEIRLSGYNIIGLSLSIQGAFSDLLDISSFNDAIFEDLGSMEFRHLSKLINLVFVPLVTYCPSKFWKKWMLNLLRPLLDHCEDLLYFAWFSLMHHGRAKVPYYFGKLSGPTENIEKFEDTQLLEFTREVSHLLGVLSSPESNNGLLHYLLTHDCLGSSRMSLFGYWVDDEATTSAISFCLAMVRLAGSTDNERCKLFVADELLPSIIRRLDDQLPCAMRNLIFKFNSSTNDTVDKDLIVLCEEIYIYISSNLYPQSQDLMGGEKGNAYVENNFTCWLAKQKEDLRAKAFCSAPMEFNGEWNWEFEDEFQRYLPVYFNMLQEVDAMDDSAEGDCSGMNALLQKLNPQFRSKYAIYSSEHPYLREISRMQKRKFCSMNQVRHYKKMYDLLGKLITLKPYIKGSDRSYSVIERLEENLEIQSTFDAYEVDQSVGVLLCHVLYFWEPRFHPLIREEHKDLLLQIVGQLTNAKENKQFQPLTPDPGDFAPHLKPYARFYIQTKLKMSMVYYGNISHSTWHMRPAPGA
ncbi:hypothetical protein DAI22_11g147600 [Oryza sativa Japonica Group]|nr:hypothetical protein DAI22_11g147600 [Oryza sativa Japonica Group]